MLFSSKVIQLVLDIKRNFGKLTYLHGLLDNLVLEATHELAIPH